MFKMLASLPLLALLVTGTEWLVLPLDPRLPTPNM
jgi:hypothetical protein